MLSEFSSFIFLFVAVVVLVWLFAFAYLLFLFEDNVSCNPWFECSKLLRMSFNFCPPASTSQILALQVYATTPMDPFFFPFLTKGLNLITLPFSYKRLINPQRNLYSLRQQEFRQAPKHQLFLQGTLRRQVCPESDAK